MLLMPEFRSLSISSLDDFVFGVSPKPVALANGMVIGGGTVYPELNFTLPGMQIAPETMDEVRAQYSEMITGACTRAVELHVPGLVVEFELLPELTQVPEWGAGITRILSDALREMQARHGIPTALRVTPNDIREFARPPVMRQGVHYENMLRSFALCAENGADFLSIESTGGKEVHDEAILNGDLALAVYALGVLGSRDMAFLWKQIVGISADSGAVPAGDSACGFANTAMVLAEQKFIPRVWAALIRVLTVPRSLAAFEAGAVGPNKDCAYEGPYIKAITGCPISLEGAEAACAHFSPVGNIAKATPDLWSNESVNNIRLLGGMAPTVSLEQLAYAARLMNTAAGHGADSARQLRDWWVESDSAFDPQAYVLRPDVVLDLAGQIIAEPTPYLRTRRAALATLQCLREAAAGQAFPMTKLETRWLDKLSKQAETLPEDEDALEALVAPALDANKVRLSEYSR
jgi:methanol--5-hydroxybenzimidazolylcobamide Co-methyltransferase